MAQIVIDSQVDTRETALALVESLFNRTPETPASKPETPPAAKPAAVAAKKPAAKKTPKASAAVVVESPATPEPPAAAGTPIEGFTPARMKRYVQNLSESGIQILRYMAQHAPQLELGEIQRHFDLPPRKWAGTMTTFGFAARETKGVDRMPFERDRKVYRIDERVAKMALDALDNLGL